VANGLHVPPIAYKLRSPSDLIYGYPVTAGEDRLQPRDRLIGYPLTSLVLSCLVIKLLFYETAVVRSSPICICGLFAHTL